MSFFTLKLGKVPKEYAPPKALLYRQNGKLLRLIMPLHEQFAKKYVANLMLVFKRKLMHTRQVMS